MAIIAFGDTFAAPWKKWALAQTDEEELVPDTSASASFGWDIPGMETTPPEPEPEPGVDSTSYDGAQWDAEPVYGEGIGSALGNVFNGSGEGLGFDLVREPTDGWASQYEEPEWADPTSYDGASWDAEPVSQGFETWDFSAGLPANLNALYSDEESWADVQDWRNVPASPAETSGWGLNELAPAPGGIFSRIGDSLGSGEGWGFDLISEPTDDWAAQYEPEPFTPAEEWGGGMGFAPPEEAPAPSRWSGLADQYAELPQPEYELSLNDWSMPNLAATAGLPNDWWRMDADEKGEYLWQSGIATDALTSSDWAAMSPEVRFKLGYAEQERSNPSNMEWLGDNVLRPLDVVNSNVFEPIGDAVLDPMLDPLDSTGNRWSPLQKDFWSKGPSLNIDLGGDPDNINWSAPLEDTVGNIRDASSPWDFAEKQDEEFKDRSMASQMALQALGPGNGLWKNIDALPGWLKQADNIADLLQGGFISDIPGAGTALRNVIAPAGVGAIGGAATEAIFDPSYTDQWGNEYNPGMLESIAGGASIGLGLSGARKIGTTPFGAGTNNVSGFILPKELAGAKPRFNFGEKAFIPTFDDDLDKALYIVAGKTRSKSDAKYMDELRAHFPELSDEQIRAKGSWVQREVKEKARYATIPAGKKVADLRIEPIEAGEFSANPVAAVDELSTVPSPFMDEVIEEPADDLIRAQQEVRALDSDAAASSGFFPQNLVTPTVADEGLSTVPAGIVDEVFAETRPAIVKLPPDERLSAATIEKAMQDAGHDDYMKKFYHYSGSDGTVGVDDLLNDPSAQEMKNVTRQVLDKQFPDTDMVTLYRAEGPGSPEKLTSWSDDPSVPAKVVGVENVISMDVSKDDVLAYYNTARGLNQYQRFGNEREYLVLGNEGRRIVEAAGYTRVGDSAVSPLGDAFPAPTPPPPPAPPVSPPQFGGGGDLVSDAVARITATQAVDRTAARAALRTQQEAIAQEALAQFPDDAAQARRIWGQRLNGVNMSAIGDLPGFTDEEVSTLQNIVGKEASRLGYGGITTMQAVGTVKRWVDPAAENPTPGQLNTLKAILTGQPPAVRDLSGQVAKGIQPGMFDEMGSVVPPRATMTEAGTIAPSRPLDEVPESDLRLKGRESADEAGGLGERPRFFDEWELATGVRNTDPFPTDATSAAIPGLRSPEPRPLTPRAPDPNQPRVDEWSQQMLDSLSGVRSRTKRDEALMAAKEKLQNEIRAISDEFRAENTATLAKDRVSARLQKIENEKIAEDIVNWRASAYEDLWNLSGEPRGGSLASLAKKGWDKAGGAIKVPLADGLDRYGQKLEDLLRTRDVPEDVARELVHREQNLYIDARFGDKLATDPERAIVEHLYTAIYQGRYQPDVPHFTGSGGKRINEIAKPDDKTGEVAGWIRGGETLAKKVKNQVFGLTDMAALGMNALPAITQGSMGITAGYMARLLDAMGYPVIDRPTMAAIRRDAPLYIKTGGSQAQDLLNPEAGTILGGLSNISRDITGVGLKPLDIVDTKLSKWNDLLSKVQYQWIMDTAIRKPLYEGNLVLMKPFGVDVGTVKAQRAAGNMADAVTSAATLSRTNTRRSLEGMLAGSAMFTRAQGNVLINAGKLLNGSGPERIVAATTILSFLGAVGIASTVAGNSIDLEPIKDGKFNNNFGTVTIPSGEGSISFKLFPQTQVARVAAQSMSALANMDAKEGYDAWAKFLIGRTGPLPGNILKGATGIGYDPSAESWSYPEINLPGERFDVEGKGGVWGGSMSFLERALAFSPLPTNVTSGLLGWMDGEPPSIQETIANLAGLSAYNVGEFQQALAKEGVDSLDDLGTEGDREIAQREFYYKYRDQLEFRDDSGVVSEKTKQKEVATGQFEKNITGETVGAWREKMDDYNNQISGAFQQMGLSPDKRPEQPGIDQQIWDFNETFRKARLDADGNDAGLIDTDKLDDLQAEFWAKNPDPETRRRLIEYQLANKGMEAERLYIKDMAILNGFDPDTGLPMVYPPAKPGDQVAAYFAGKEVPSYFDMTKWKYNVIDNQQMKPVVAEFTKWKDAQPGGASGVDKEVLFRAFIKREMPTAPDGQPWDTARIQDFVNYDKPTAQTEEYKYFKNVFKGPVEWMDKDSHWQEVLQEHE